jgi:CDP-diacylglycerol--glycerol-3-phosphate 3-phosphatidyltransferase
MRHRLTIANALSVLRIALGVSLLATPALSPAFLGILAAAGLTDMLDGFVARRTGTESELGARLDSAADLTLAVICLARVLPAVAVPAWLWAWVAVIVVVKVANVVSGLAMRRRLVMPHTTANKAAGIFVFLVPFAIPTLGVVAPSIPACAVATFAAVQEGHLIRTGRV